MVQVLSKLIWWVAGLLLALQLDRQPRRYGHFTWRQIRREIVCWWRCRDTFAIISSLSIGPGRPVRFTESSMASLRKRFPSIRDARSLRAGERDGVAKRDPRTW